VGLRRAERVRFGASRDDRYRSPRYAAAFISGWHHCFMAELVVTRTEQQSQRKPRSGLLEPLEAPRQPAPSDLPADRFINRETSWLDFNARVLALAEDVSTPLLERAKFLAIFASNLDEFYMVRVAGLMRREATGLAVLSADGLTPHAQLEL